MDLRKTGLFITTLRKGKQMTQKELADKIGVTDKAISRWETGKGFPDVSILKTLAEVLDVSISEIVTGENIEKESIMEKSDEALLEALAYSKRMTKSVTGIVLLICGVGFILFPILFMGTRIISIFTFLGVALVLIAVFILRSRKSLKARNNRKLILSKQIAGLLSIVCLLITIALESLPDGAVLIFASSPDTTAKKTFSYFSFSPVWYAHFFPFLTAVFTVALTFLSLVALTKKFKMQKLQNATFICTIITFAFSVISIFMFGSDYITAVSIQISVFLLITIALQTFANREEKI